MAENDPEDLEYIGFPEVGELVISTCTKVDSHGAYFRLDEYELDETAGYVHVSELAKTWVRQISAHIRVGQKAVTKVLRVNRKLGQIDLSIRRVTDKERQQRMQELKQEQRIKGLLKAIGEQKKIDIESKLLRSAVERYGSVYRALEETYKQGNAQILIDLGLEKDLADFIFTEASSVLEPPSVTITANVIVMVYVSKGIDILKKMFQDILQQNRDITVEVSAVSAPKYRINITAPDWKQAERQWKEIQDHLEDRISKTDGQIQFEREN